MNGTQLALFFVALAPVAQAQTGVSLMDDRAFVHLMVDEFEFADIADENDFVWDMDLSMGGDLHKAWMKSRGEQSDTGADQSEVQLLYSKAVLPFWDLQAGVRRDLDPGPERNWATIAIRGLAPYFFDVEAELFFAEGGQRSIRAKGEYELLLTQRLILSPELEVLAYGRNEPGRLIGSGLSEIEFDVRLRYEIKRELAPYIGLGWYRLYGATRDFAKAAGQDGQDVVMSVGVRAWF